MIIPRTSRTICENKPNIYIKPTRKYQIQILHSHIIEENCIYILQNINWDVSKSSFTSPNLHFVFLTPKDHLQVFHSLFMVPKISWFEASIHPFPFLSHLTSLSPLIFSYIFPSTFLFLPSIL